MLRRAAVGSAVGCAMVLMLASVGWACLGTGEVATDLQVSPNRTTAGSTVTVTLSNTKPASIHWDSASGRTLGSGTGQVRVQVPSDAVAGPHRIVAVWAGDSLGAPLEVISPTLSSGSSDQGNGGTGTVGGPVSTEASGGSGATPAPGSTSSAPSSQPSGGTAGTAPAGAGAAPTVAAPGGDTDSNGIPTALAPVGNGASSAPAEATPSPAVPTPAVPTVGPLAQQSRPAKASVSSPAAARPSAGTRAVRAPARKSGSTQPAPAAASGDPGTAVTPSPHSASDEPASAFSASSNGIGVSVADLPAAAPASGTSGAVAGILLAIGGLMAMSLGFGVAELRRRRVLVAPS